MSGPFLAVELCEAVFAAQRPITGKLGLDAGAQEIPVEVNVADVLDTAQRAEVEAGARIPGGNVQERGGVDEIPDACRRATKNTCGRAEVNRMGMSEFVDMLDKS